MVGEAQQSLVLRVLPSALDVSRQFLRSIDEMAFANPEQ